MPAWQTADLGAEPDYRSKTGAAEIRLLPGFDRGELAYATVPPRAISEAGVLHGLDELFYVMAGDGGLWRDGVGEVRLVPGRCVAVKEGVPYAYRTAGEELRMLVASTPRFMPDSWQPIRAAELPTGGLPEAADGAGSFTDLSAEPDYAAPDTSEIRLLPNIRGGGLAHCTLPAGQLSLPVRHRSVDEIWYVLEGEGELWRSAEGEEEVAEMRPDRCLTIPVATTFQFRTTGEEPLRFIIGTFPPWPGQSEADECVTGKWVQ